LVELTKTFSAIMPLADLNWLGRPLKRGGARRPALTDSSVCCGITEAGTIELIYLRAKKTGCSPPDTIVSGGLFYFTIIFWPSTGSRIGISKKLK
jgi:hypothetical protein